MSDDLTKRLRKTERRLSVGFPGKEERADMAVNIAKAADTIDRQAAEIARLRGLVRGANVNLWDRAEISERDDAGNQTILLWHPSGSPLVQLRIEAYSPGLEAGHRDIIMADLLDVFQARAALKGGEDAEG